MDTLQLPPGPWASTLLEQNRHGLRFGPPDGARAAAGRGGALALAAGFTACAATSLMFVPERITSATLAGVFISGAILAALKAVRRDPCRPYVTVDFDRLQVLVEGPREAMHLVSEATVWVHPQEMPKSVVLGETIYEKKMWWLSLMVGEGSPLGPTILPLIGMGFRRDMEIAGQWLEPLGPWKGLIIE